jgi:hypothetical protein
MHPSDLKKQNKTSRKLQADILRDARSHDPALARKIKPLVAIFSDMVIRGELAISEADGLPLTRESAPITIRWRDP